MKISKISIKVIGAAAAAFVSLSGCTLTATRPDLGLAGFYRFGTVTDHVDTDEATATRISEPNAAVFVYRINTDRIAIGEGTIGFGKKTFDEISGGVIISVDSAKKLSAYLQKALAQYDKKDKKVSSYLDFIIFATGETVEHKRSFQGGQFTDEEIKATRDTVSARFEYVYDDGAQTLKETMNFYFRGAQGPKTLQIMDLKALAASLQKL